MTRASDTAKLLGAGATILDGTTISTADNTDTLTLTSTDADANSGSNLRLYRNSSSPAQNDLLGNIQWEGRNNNSQDVIYAEMRSQIETTTDGSEDANFKWSTMIGGTLVDRLAVNANATVFNDDSVDIDFRVESNGNANMLFVNGANDNVGIGRDPDATRVFHVSSARADYYHTQLEHTASSGNVYGLDMHFSGQAPNNGTSNFMRCRDTGAVRFNIASDGDVTNGGNSYGGISDEKLKEQIADASSQWDDIKALKVRKFKMKDDVAKGDSDDHWKLGVVAQEVETAGMNGLVTTKKDLNLDTDEELETTTKSIKYSVLYMKAVKALQEAMTRIETLEAKVTTLESA